MTIVLPASNEEARLGPALDEARWLAEGRPCPSILVGGTGLVDAGA